MWNDFKNFAFKGNAFDLAVGVVMGGAFGAIVTSVVSDMLMPLISVVTGGTNFSATGRFCQARQNQLPMLTLPRKPLSLAMAILSKC